MKFMITFPLTHRDYKQRISRFLETGAPFPEGVNLLGRWFTASHSKAFVLVESDRAGPLFEWTSTWADIIDFQIEPGLADTEAAAVLQDIAAR